MAKSGIGSVFAIVFIGLGCDPQRVEASEDDPTANSNEDGPPTDAGEESGDDDGDESGSEEDGDEGDIDDTGECSLEADAAPSSRNIPASQCSNYFDEVVGPAVEVRFTNTSDQDVFTPYSACYEGSFSLFGPGNEAIPWTDDGWITDCEEIITKDSCGGAACAANVYRIVPGGWVTQRWHGGMLAHHILPESCYPGGDCGPECDQLVQVDPGCIAFQVEWSTSYGCYATPEPECTCEPSAEGSCIVKGGAELQQPVRTTRRTIRYPEAQHVEFALH